MQTFFLLLIVTLICINFSSNFYCTQSVIIIIGIILPRMLHVVARRAHTLRPRVSLKGPRRRRTIGSTACGVLGGKTMLKLTLMAPGWLRR